MNRRKFLTLVGGGVVIAAGAAGASIVTRSPDKALKPWSDAGTLYDEPRRKALSYALLAPNPHNRQPWQVDLSKQDTVVLTVDTERLLPHTDPYNRQITIGLGCFIELMRMAAAEDGFRVDLTLFPEGFNNRQLNDRPVAEAVFVKDASVKPDPLFQHVFERRSVKEPYQLDRTVAGDALDRIKSAAQEGSAVGTNNDADKVEAMRALTSRALEIEIETPHTYKESVDLFRIGAREVNQNPDGIDFTGPMFETMALTGLFSREAALDRNNAAYTEGVKAVLENTMTAMAHLWQVTPGNSRIDQIHAGQDWIRLNLAATREGLSMQPLSQALQEYPEMSELYAKVHSDLAPDGGTVQMLARLGYAAPVAQSPRWPLEAKIVKQ
ncbi:MAG: twin-arginine translocation pathway signal protein [Pseudomonadota bacterium]